MVSECVCIDMYESIWREKFYKKKDVKNVIPRFSRVVLLGEIIWSKKRKILHRKDGLQIFGIKRLLLINKCVDDKKDTKKSHLIKSMNGNCSHIKENCKERVKTKQTNNKIGEDECCKRAIRKLRFCVTHQRVFYVDGALTTFSF